MDTLEKILIGFALFVLTSIIAILFKTRQLYVTTPKLFKHSTVSDGTMCELIIYNRGWQVEEEIRVEIDPALRIELLASSVADLTLENALLNLPRLHKNSEASAVLLVEKGNLEPSKIQTISSKATKGRVCKSKEVPPNYGASALIACLILGFPALMFFAPVTRVADAYAAYRLSEASSSGWGNLSDYYFSDFRKSYQGGEFPLVLVENSIKPDSRSAQFSVFNKSAMPLEVYTGKAKILDIGFSVSARVEPLSKRVISVVLPPQKSDSASTDFMLASGREYIRLTYSIRPAAAE